MGESVFNGGMAKSEGGQKKKPAVKKQSKKVEKPSLLARLKRIPWYGWILIAVVLVFSAMQLYKYCATKHDIALLDQAEAKMRQIEFPAGGTKTFSRSCSVKSVKYGNPGRPTCRVELKVEYPKNQLNNASTKALIRSIESSGFTVSLTSAEDTNHYYTVSSLTSGLNCYLSDSLSSLDTSTAMNTKNIYCQKKFWNRVYPVK